VLSKTSQDLTVLYTHDEQHKSHIADYHPFHYQESNQILHINIIHNINILIMVAKTAFNYKSRHKMITYKVHVVD